MERLLAIWNRLPKSVKVFFYLAVSTILAEALIEFRDMDQTFVVRIMAQLFNFAIVLLQDSVPAVRNRLRR